MKSVSLSYSYRTHGYPKAALLVGALVLGLLIGNAVLVGLTIGARASLSRVRANAETSSAHIAELESALAGRGLASEADAHTRGFTAPTAFSYTTVRPLGASIGNEL